jgi:CRP/FNR family cyclic AMP-dependent transcriptional regulator
LFDATNDSTQAGDSLRIGWAPPPDSLPRAMSLFDGLDEGERAMLTRCGEQRSYFKHTIVASEGDAASALFILTSGLVNLFVSDSDGRKFVLSSHGPGECLGEAVLDGGPWPVSVETVEPCRMWALSRDVILRAMADYPSIAMHFLHVLSRRTRVLTDCTKTLALNDVYGRVVKLLGDLSVENGGGRVVARHITQDAIATRIGASREMVNRVMRDLTTGGYLQSVRGKIRILRKPPAHW